MKKIAIGILVVVLIVVCAFCGAILYIPTPDEDYPQDYTVEEYKDNIQKNRDLIVSKLEEINAPTLKETMKQYEKDADSLKLYPTALDTIEAAETKFIEDNRLPVLKKYRTERFMEKYYPDPVRGRFICESWLLSPVLKELLPENSKILAFQNRFEIISENREDRDYIEWVFQAPPGTEIRQLPEKTSLQRNVKRLLLEGGNVGAACGIIGISGENKA